MKRNILKDAIRQVKTARQAIEAEGEEWDCSLGKKQEIEYIEDTLNIKNHGVEQRRIKRNERANLHRSATVARREKIEEEDIKSQWFFDPGDLVLVKASRRGSIPIGTSRPSPGTIAVVVSTIDITNYKGIKAESEMLTVMVNGVIENWPAKWVKHCD